MSTWLIVLAAAMAVVVWAQDGRAEEFHMSGDQAPAEIICQGPAAPGQQDRGDTVRLACLEGLGSGGWRLTPESAPWHDTRQVYSLSRPAPQARYKLADGIWDLDLVVLHALDNRRDDEAAPLPERPLDQAEAPGQRSAFSFIFSYDF